MKSVLVATVAACLAFPVSAQTDADGSPFDGPPYVATTPEVIGARQVRPMLLCASLAEIGARPEVAGVFIDRALTRARAFAGALVQGTIPAVEVERFAPEELVEAAPGHGVDFTVGRIFQEVYDITYGDLDRTVPLTEPDTAFEAAALGRFADNRCKRVL